MFGGIWIGRWRSGGWRRRGLEGVDLGAEKRGFDPVEGERCGGGYGYILTLLTAHHMFSSYLLSLCSHFNLPVATCWYTILFVIWVLICISTLHIAHAIVEV